MLREVRGLRKDLRSIAQSLAQIASELHYRNQMEHPRPDPAALESGPLVEVSFSDPREVVEMMDIELSLTQARGMPPSEDEIMQEYARRHGTAPL